METVSTAAQGVGKLLYHRGPQGLLRSRGNLGPELLFLFGWRPEEILGSDARKSRKNKIICSLVGGVVLSVLE